MYLFYHSSLQCIVCGPIHTDQLLKEMVTGPLIQLNYAEYGWPMFLCKHKVEIANSS